ncbi:hypothetical protein H8L32_26435 [Undibacterium sp. CY18W]|uniref:4Fe-4S ferredoxin-type domain-containing protein n=1 Tax=Undibacterium hunanense TaxID=2762292 RepID=A0ABR6ZZE9_9BURK|nr:hypothetical protein [Undibacterium hunanense]MBC3921029.1 hypothetical protein [Undibacterium hunanense]
MDSTIIWLQANAPMKPLLGQPCNGCGVCCAAEPCPVARVFLWQLRGSCLALEWHADVQQYRCGMLVQPATYLRWLPTSWQAWFAKRVRRWIAAGTACDSDALAANGALSEDQT